ncbi:DUF1648 domain-containing protein [Pseudalkalibacillus hwajinpoensis]|uniref:DUF1648 domain-containing protein n=1 Tax=Guptibacillus hwajinpoensis TaxID=208199 RepID=UPI00325C1B5E
MMEKRPKIKVEKSFLQRLFDLGGLVMLLLCLLYLYLEWSALPEEVPIHFNGQGEVNDWGGKGSLLLLPLIGAVIWIGFSFLERYPHVYNYVVKITKGNAELQYRSAVSLIHFLKNTIAILFAYLTWETILVASGERAGLIDWVLPAFLMLIFGAIVLYVIHSIRWR